MKGSGRTDGEEPERGWSKFDGVSTSTQEMGPGSREETLEDHFAWNNEVKYITMGASQSEYRFDLLTNLRLANRTESA